MSANDSNFDLSTTINNYTATTSLEVNPVVARFLIALYAIFFVVGLFGNIIVVTVVAKHKSMQTTTNKFIACLSASDILLCLFAVPFTPTNALLKSWIFGNVMCKTVPAVLAVSVFVSTFTSVAIAVDRYMMIVHPHVKRISSKIQICLIIAIWVASILISAPIVIYTSLQDQPNDIKACREHWPEEKLLMAYNWVVMVFQLILPALIIIFCYTAVSIQLNKRAKMKLGSRQNDKARIEARKKKRINRMLIAMVTIFIGCWLPIDVYHFVVDYIPEKHQLTIFLITHAIAMSSVMYNPFLYGYMNGNFKLYFQKVIPGLRKHRQRMKEDDSKLTTQTMIKSVKSDGSLHELAPMMNSNNCCKFNTLSASPVVHADSCHNEQVAFMCYDDPDTTNDQHHNNPGFKRELI